MKRRLCLSLALMGLMCLVAWTARAQLQKTGVPVPAWEHHEILLSATAPSVPTLNRYGAEGWELVNVIAACPGSTGNCQYWAYMKRRTR